MTSQLVTNVSGRLPQWGEFAPGAPTQANPRGHNGDCVEYSFMVARAAAQPARACDGVELDRLTNEAVDDGEASSSGAMTNAELAWLCSKEGVTYQQITAGDLVALAQATAGRKAICMGFSNGQALPGNEPGVFGHCIAVLDWTGAAFTVANGDSTNGEAGKLDMVTPAQLAAAQPTQITILEVSMIPNGWTDDGTTLKAPNGVPVVQGFRDHILSTAWFAADTPFGPEYGRDPVEYANASMGAGTRQDFRFHSLGWTQDWGVYEIALGQDFAYLLTHQAAAPAVDVAGIKTDLQSALAKLGG